MKKPLLATVGVAGACAACCAAPLVLPVIGSLSAAGVAAWAGRGDALVPAAAAALLLAAAAGAAWWQRRRKARAACACTQSCAAP